jgi:rhamnopyranosyl-N-acetylglucosaminyl-diphospho-decaprenol beta-1,3/1,4-galactofuranosyltransferase
MSESRPEAEATRDHAEPSALPEDSASEPGSSPAEAKRDPAAPAPGGPGSSESAPEAIDERDEVAPAPVSGEPVSEAQEKRDRAEAAPVVGGRGTGGPRRSAPNPAREHDAAAAVLPEVEYGADAKIVAVVVTHKRRDLLAESLKAVATQSRAVDHLIVIDNGNEAEVAELVADQPVETTYLGSAHNLGGAGGFALGMLHALSLGADWVWLADDDGRPEGPEVLATLFDCARRHELVEVSPVVCDIDEPDRLAFPLRRGVVWRRLRSELGGEDFLPGIASLFNGALISAQAVDVIGVPDLRLFVRGDEVEVHRRLVRSGLPFGTCLQTAYLHPNGAAEFKPILGGRMHTQYPDDPVKRYFTYRNRGYLMSQPGMRKLLPQEWIRFSWFFLVTRRDPAGLREWFHLRSLGRNEQFQKPD